MEDKRSTDKEKVDCCAMLACINPNEVVNACPNPPPPNPDDYGDSNNRPHFGMARIIVNPNDDSRLNAPKMIVSQRGKFSPTGVL